MYEKGPRQFYDDTCVVPEKFDGMYDTSLFLFLVWGDEKGRDEGLFSLADQKSSVTFQFRIP